MNQESCEKICLAAMAVADGEKPPIPASDIEFHLAQCARCRSEVGQLKSVIDLLDGQDRREQTASVWGGVAETLKRRNEARAAPDHWPWFLLLGLFLAGCRIVVAVSDLEPGLWVKLAPLLLVIAVFGLLRENPFKVNPGLQYRHSLRGDL
jgi:anti-sigma factor RsiW